MRCPLARRGLIAGCAPALVILLAAAAATPAGERYAFLVAVGDYDKKELKPLQFTRSDILELHQVLVDSGYRKNDIVLMHDDLKQLSSRRFFPEAAKIREELKLLLAGLEKDDSLIVAFSGHGVQFKGKKQNYFCPADAKLDDRATLIALSDLYEMLEKCPARQKLLLVDACRDDPQSQLGKSRQTVDLESVTRPQTEAVPEGLIALFSCGAGQRSFEDPDLKHGVFFYHVLEGLKGAARNRDEEVTLDDLVSFTRKQTQSFARNSLAVVQTPQQLGDFTGTWVLRNLKTSPSKPKGPLAAGTKAGQEWDGNGLKMKFCWCPDGTFAMGSPRDETERQPSELLLDVTLTGFWIGKYEMTQSEWKSVMGTTVEQKAAKETLFPSAGFGPNYPMYFVSQVEATEFARKYTQQERSEGRLPAGWEYRLPTEAQWEYACRAGTKTRFASGDAEKELAAHAWFATNSEKATHEVGTKAANAWGLHDVHGNVWEWCRDWSADQIPGGRNPEVTQEAMFKVYRGGSWDMKSWGCRSAYRGWMGPGFQRNDIGFRLAAVQVSQ